MAAPGAPRGLGRKAHDGREGVPAAPRAVARVEVWSLFGLYHHRVVWKRTLGERVTILHGPNGIGKTVLLRMIDALFRGDPSRLAEVPYERLQVELTDGTIFDVWPQASRRRRGGIPSQELKFVHQSPDGEVSTEIFEQFDLLRITDAVRCDVVLATHSPFIVGDRSDLLVALDGGDNGDR